MAPFVPAAMSRTTAIAGLLTFGTLCSLFAKLIYYAEGANRYGQIAKFEKPWFQVLAVRAPLSCFHRGRFFLLCARDATTGCLLEALAPATSAGVRCERWCRAL